MSEQLAAGIRKRFCVRCERRVDLEADIGAVELTTGEVMCGADVDNLIAEIHIDWRTNMFSHHGTRGQSGAPRQATRHGQNAFNPPLSREPKGEWL